MPAARIAAQCRTRWRHTPCALAKHARRPTIAAGGTPWTPRRAAITRSTRAGSAIRRASGARPRPRSTGSRSRRPCSIGKAGVYGRWFPDGVCNTCWNAVDRHVEAGRGEQAAIIYDSPVTNTKQTITYAALQTKTETLAGILQHDFGVEKGDRVILYMPMVPEALVAMLACARIGAIHSVVFGGFAPKELATRIDDCKPKVILSASCGIEVHARHSLQAAARRGDQARQAQAAGLPDPAAAAGEAPSWSPGRDHDWQTTWDDGAGLGAATCSSRVPMHGDRSALHPLHLGHDRHPEGRGARQRRPHGRAEMVDEEPLRRRARRVLVGGLRHRLGGRPQLHRLCAAAARLHHDPLRGQAGRHAGRRRVLARDRRARLRRDVHRADRVPRHQEGRPAGQAVREIRPVEIPHAVPRRRARRSRHHRLGGEPAEEAGDRSLVADRDRLGDRRQSGGPRPASGQARLADRADAGLRPARGRRRLQGGAARHDGLARGQAAAAAVVPADAVAGRRPHAARATSPSSPATTRPRTPASSTRTATST